MKIAPHVVLEQMEKAVAEPGAALNELKEKRREMNA